MQLSYTDYDDGAQGSGSGMGGAVGQCAVDADCSAGQICINGLCVTACLTDTDCPAGYVCLDGLCYLINGCSVDADCPPGYVCVGGVCVTEESQCCGGWVSSSGFGDLIFRLKAKLKFVNAGVLPTQFSNPAYILNQDPYAPVLCADKQTLWYDMLVEIQNTWMTSSYLYGRAPQGWINSLAYPGSEISNSAPPILLFNVGDYFPAPLVDDSCGSLINDYQIISDQLNLLEAVLIQGSQLALNLRVTIAKGPLGSCSLSIPCAQSKILGTAWDGQHHAFNVPGCTPWYTFPDPTPAPSAISAGSGSYSTGDGSAWARFLQWRGQVRFDVSTYVTGKTMPYFQLGRRDVTGGGITPSNSFSPSRPAYPVSFSPEMTFCRWTGPNTQPVPLANLFTSAYIYESSAIVPDATTACPLYPVNDITQITWALYDQLCVVFQDPNHA